MVGELIWVSFRPLVRLCVPLFNSKLVRLMPVTDFFVRTICTAAGFAMAKADLFPPSASRSAGQIILVSVMMPEIPLAQHTISEHYTTLLDVLENCPGVHFR
jgi:hypothetical protein